MRASTAALAIKCSRNALNLNSTPHSWKNSRIDRPVPAVFSTKMRAIEARGSAASPNSQNPSHGLGPGDEKGCLEDFPGQRFAEQVALHFIAIEQPQQPRLLFRLHAFGHHIELQGMG